MRVDKILASLVAGSLMGIYIARFGDITYGHLFLVALIILLVSIKLPRVFVIFIMMIGISIGMMRSQPILSKYDTLSNHYGDKVSIEATVINDPVYHKTGQFELNANNLQLNISDIDAVLRVRSFTNDVRRGDRVLVTGKLREGFAYWQGSIYFAEMEVLARDPNLISEFRANFISNIFSTVPDPEGSLGLGFLIGVRSLLPEDLTTQLSITGLTHIVAVSGYNLTILANVSKRFFHRFSRFQAVTATFSLILAFVAVTGVSPSILRAVIVSTLSIGAWYYGRSVSPWLLLLYSSGLSAMINPAYAWFNLGWYLSLAAFFGVLIIAPMVQGRIFGAKQPKLIAQIAIETTSAQLLTLPIIMMVFGQVSLVAIFANILVLPLIPISMLLTFMLGSSYFISHIFAGIIAAPTYLVLRFITSIIRLMSNVNWALLEVSLSVYQMVLVYFLIAILWLGLNHAKQPDLL